MTGRSLPRLLSACVPALFALAACHDGTSPDNRVPAAVTVASGGGQTAAAGTALADSLVVRVVDSGGRPVRNAQVTFTMLEGNDTFSPAATTTNSDGRAATRWTLGPVAGTQHRVEARVLSASGAVLLAVQATATAVSGPPATLAILGGNGQTGVPGAALADSLAVRATDALGNPIANAAIGWTVQTGGGSVSPASTPTNAQGIAKTRWTLGPTGGIQRVDAAIGGASPAIFQANATSLSITVISPAPNAVSGDTLQVRASATTARAGDAIARIRATVDGRTVILTPGPGGATGVLDLAGLAEGAKTLRVSAISVLGDSLEKQVPFAYDRRPTLNVTAPLEGTVVLDGQLRVDVDCVDAGGCTRVDVFLISTLAATGTTSVHTTIPVTGLDGRTVTVRIRGTDTANQTREVTRTIYVQSSAAWTELASAGTVAVDVDATRLLYIDTLPRALRIHPLAGGGDETLRALTVNDELVRGFLFPAGAIFVTQDPGLFARVYEWRAGTLTDVGPVNSSGSLHVSGSWAIWNSGGGGFVNLVRRDLAAGTNLTVASNAGNTDNDVAENGAVAWWNSSYDVVLRDPAGGLTAVTSDGGVARWNTYPVTDGQNVLFRRHPPCCPAPSEYRIARWSGGTVTELSNLGANEVIPHRDYEAAGGHSAFVRRDGGGTLRIYVIGTDGVERLAAGGAGDARIEALAGNGDLVFARGGRRIVARAPYTTEIDLGPAQGKVFYRGTTLYAVLGRSGFRITY